MGTVSIVSDRGKYNQLGCEGPHSSEPVFKGFVDSFDSCLSVRREKPDSHNKTPVISAIY